ncbi:hypothetical protein EK21DRAFT_111754 [Setomelanomma holmii]|uniref:Uncharacterized protein n=1 Tax=Setomelanomma holmii TaxID=210430 RepID=A0A9P4LM91_9PLEO|nr:hypothetical protein EK21DRAFT_111754 [Setomelanomma holmii]
MNQGNEGTAKAQCKRIRVLAALNWTASDAGILDSLVASGKMKEDQRRLLQSSAAGISSQLELLMSNATLKKECDIINASRKDARQCRSLKKLEKKVDLARNDTVAAEGPNAEVQAEKNKGTIDKLEVELQKLKSNTTLLNFCNTDPAVQQGPQANGQIGNQEVDNSGAIGISTSEADTYVRKASSTTYLSVSILLAVFLQFQIDYP